MDLSIGVSTVVRDEENLIGKVSTIDMEPRLGRVLSQGLLRSRVGGLTCSRIPALPAMLRRIALLGEDTVILDLGSAA
jgi:hypothetical protein